MNMKKTVVLAVLLLGAFLYMRKIAIPSHQREAQKGVLFPGLSAADIQSVRFSHVASDNQSAEIFELRAIESIGGARTPTAKVEEGEAEATLVDWEFVSIPGAVLDKVATGGVASALKELDLGAPIEESGIQRDLSVFGLDRPVLTLVVKTKTHGETEIAFGNRYEYLSQRYVKATGRSEVYLVNDGVFAALNKGSRDIRSKTPIQFNDPDLREVSIRSASALLKLKQVSAGEWRIIEPVELAASGVLVAELLRSLKDLRVAEFVDDGARVSQLHLGEPQVQVSLAFTDTRKPQNVALSLYEASATPGGSKAVYFKSSQVTTVFKSSLDSVGKFMKSSDDLREKRLIALKVDEIEKIQASGEKVAPVEILATATDWTVNGKRSDPVFVEQFLNDLVALEANEFPSEVPSDAFGETFLKLVLTKKGDKKDSLVVRVGKERTAKGGVSRWIQVGDTGPIATVRDVEAKRIVPREEALVEAPKQPTPSAAATPP